MQLSQSHTFCNCNDYHYKDLAKDYLRSHDRDHDQTAQHYTRSSRKCEDHAALSNDPLRFDGNYSGQDNFSAASHRSNSSRSQTLSRDISSFARSFAMQIISHWFVPVARAV